jgi:hypothetical protein
LLQLRLRPKDAAPAPQHSIQNFHMEEELFLKLPVHMRWDDRNQEASQASDLWCPCVEDQVLFPLFCSNRLGFLLYPLRFLHYRRAVGLVLGPMLRVADPGSEI